MRRLNAPHLLAAALLAVSALVAQLGVVATAQAQTAADCNFLAPFGPAPRPNWNTTLANSPDGVGFRVHNTIASNPVYLAEVLQAVDTWNSAIAVIDLRYLGPTSTMPEIGAPSDNVNVIGPNPGNLPAGELGRAAVAGTTIALQFDIALNFDATIPIAVAEPGGGQADLQSVVAHELGHVFGLDHTTTMGQMMRGALVAGTQVRDFGSEDRVCAEAIYGGAPQPTPEPTPEPPGIPASVVAGASAPVEVMLTVSCLSDNGRVDVNIVNLASDSATYRIEYSGLSPRQAVVGGGDWWRMPVTGRPDGSYQVVVKRNGWIVADEAIEVSCDEVVPTLSGDEVQVVNACRNGNGYLLFQFTNPSAQPRSWIIEVAGVPNRSTSAAPWGASVRAVTGRPDGSYNVLIRSGGDITSFAVSVNCD